ncbi:MULTISPECIES: hypothetical protein [Microbacterium]|uniref:Uncharacterized protein n=2 Tax=Microbacteriaceae TaxID=85023 RepID=A0ABX5SP90_9MICO|nr:MULTISPECIES: hypothetical protein [Microbacterium]MCK6066612.1 ADP-ribosyltransferase [Microbacterium sp. EYE_512]QBR87946.1 hypothetical protein E4K62_04095 [Microbacterium wangchenii]
MIASVFSDEDFSGKVSGDLPTYHAGPRGPIRAVAIRREGVVEAYLFHGVDGDEKDAAGLISRREGDFQPQGSGYWIEELRRRHDDGVPAAEAVASLAGTAGPAYAGAADTSFESFESKASAREALEPRRDDAPRRNEPEAKRPERTEIDAALRAGGALAPRIAESVRALDSALQVRPTPEPVVVTLVRSRDSLPTDLTMGTRIHEPAYLLSLLAGQDVLPPEAEVVVKLHVPAGVPALYQDASLPGEPGTLLLARGLDWEVLRVIDMPGQIVVTGRVSPPQ